MGRHALRITILLGVLITLVGGTGIFAVFSDRATAGTDSVGTGTQAKAADIQIAEGDGIIGNVPFGCGTFEDDIATAQFSVGGIQPGFTSTAELCVTNVGAAPVTLTIGTVELTDLDIDCTGDETAAGDTTCGLDAGMLPQTGELSPLLDLSLTTRSCDDSTLLTDDGGATLDELATGNFVIADPTAAIAPGATVCVQIGVAYAPSTLDAQLAQSDVATWRFKFDATGI
jgi:hypothetical protein